MPVVVFGGSGFVGTHLMERLRAEGTEKIISVDRRKPAMPVDGITYVAGDIRDLSALSLGVTAPVIFNLAAVHTTPGHEPWEYYDANVRGAIEVTRFARRCGCQHIAFTSSISVYGASEELKDESSTPDPQSDYGRSKLMAEQIHLDWLASHSEHHLVIARPAVVFGRGEGGNFTRLAKMLRKGVFIYPGRTDTIKSCIYVCDLVDWMLHAVETRDRAVLLNGAYSERITISEIVDTFKTVAFPKAKTFTIPPQALFAVARTMAPLSAAGLGVHPDRIRKLMISTNVYPKWAESQALATRGRLEPALLRWKLETAGEYW